jgi:DNA-binding response OmpR family regulator
MKKNLTLLYVEDEPLIRQQAVEFLSRRYNTVLEASNGEEALEIYLEHQPHIIISDIEMPKMNGLEMAKKIRQKDKKIPIIIATAYTENRYLLIAVELQLIKYIVKPITTQKLEEALSLAYEYIEEDKIQSIVSLSPTTHYDILNKTLIIENRIIKLTNNEILLLDLLIRHKQRATTYEEIESNIWAYEGMSMDSLRSLVRSLRKKLGGDFLENISGIGYRVRVEV